MMSTRGEGVLVKWMNMDRGREGVKNPGNFADVICTWPLTSNPGGKSIAGLANMET